MSISWRNEPSLVKVLGKEEYLKNKTVFEGIQNLESTHEILKFRAMNDSDRAIRQAVEEGSLFTSKRMILIYDVDDLDDHAFLERYAKDPMDGKVVVLVEKEKGRTMKWLKELSADATVTHKKIPSYKLSDWLVDEAKKNGFEFNEHLASAVQESVGTSLYKLDNELKKMYLYAAPDTKISEDTVRKVLFSGLGFRSFDIYEDWALMNKKSCLMKLALFYKHKKNDPTMKLLGAFLSSTEKLIKCRSLLDQGATFDQIKKQLGGSPYILKTKTLPQSRERTLDVYLDIYDELCDAERRYKTGKEGFDLLQRILIAF